MVDVEERPPDWFTIADNISASFSASYPEVDRDDIRQELFLKLLELPDSEYETAQVVQSLTNAAINYCEREVRVLYPASSDQYYYSRDQIKELLPYVHHAERWSSFAKIGEQGQGRSNRDPAEGGDALAVYADVRRGWEALSAHERAILTHRYIEPSPTPYDALAALLDVSEEAARKQVSRAVGRMQRAMGGRKHKPAQTRKVLTNAAAQSITSHQYGGE